MEISIKDTIKILNEWVGKEKTKYFACEICKDGVFSETLGTDNKGHKNECENCLDIKNKKNELIELIKAVKSGDDFTKVFEQPEKEEILGGSNDD